MATSANPRVPAELQMLLGGLAHGQGPVRIAAMTETPPPADPEPAGRTGPPAQENVVTHKPSGNVLTRGMRMGATGCVGCATFIVLALILLVAIGSCAASSDAAAQATLIAR